MKTHIQANRGTMFSSATDMCKDALDAMCQEVKTHMTQNVIQLFNKVKDDYCSLLEGNADVFEVGNLDKKKLEDVLTSADLTFKEVLGGELIVNRPRVAEE